MLEIGQTFSSTRTLTQQDFDAFARLSGDDNPIHVDPDFARQTRFGRPVAHGMILYALICALLGHHFPGAMQIEQELIFPAPTFAGEPVTITARVVAVDGRQVRLATTIKNTAGELTCDGQSILVWEAM